MSATAMSMLMPLLTIIPKIPLKLFANICKANVYFRPLEFRNLMNDPFNS